MYPVCVLGGSFQVSKKYALSKTETRGQVEVKQRDHGTLRGEVSVITLHMEQKQEKERLARGRVENLEVSRGVCVPCTSQ